MHRGFQNHTFINLDFMQNINDSFRSSLSQYRSSMTCMAAQQWQSGSIHQSSNYPDSKVHGANKGPTWHGSCRPQMAPIWPHEPCFQGNDTPCIDCPKGGALTCLLKTMVEPLDTIVYHTPMLHISKWQGQETDYITKSQRTLHTLIWQAGYIMCFASICMKKL